MAKKKQIGEEVLKDIEEYAEEINMINSRKTKWDSMTWVLLISSILILAFGVADRNRIVIVFGGLFLTLFIIKILFGRK